MYVLGEGLNCGVWCFLKSYVILAKAAELIEAQQYQLWKCLILWFS